jgi:hypothetical protein
VDSLFKDAYTYIDEEVPALKGFPLGSNVIYIPRGIKLYIVAGALALFLVLGCAICCFYCYQMDRGIRKLKSTVSGSVHRLQRTLFISALMESILDQLFIAWPLFIVDLMIIFPIPYGSYYCYIFYITMSFQTTISAILQCYFIRPFKEAVKALLFKFFLKNTSKTVQVVTVQKIWNVNKMVTVQKIWNVNK